MSLGAALVLAGLVGVALVVMAIRAADRHAKRHRVAGGEPLVLPPKRGRKVRNDRAAQSRRSARRKRRKRAS